MHNVAEADALRSEWFENARILGVTAGTSPPDSLVDAVEQRLKEICKQL